jgi:hypothetical protein
MHLKIDILVPIYWRTFVKRLQELGIEGSYSGGEHLFIKKEDPILTISNSYKSTLELIF